MGHKYNRHNRALLPYMRENTFRMLKTRKMQTIAILAITIANACPILANELYMDANIAVTEAQAGCTSTLAKRCLADIYEYQEVCSGLTTIAGFYSCLIAYASAQLDCYPCADMSPGRIVTTPTATYLTVDSNVSLRGQLGTPVTACTAFVVVFPFLNSLTSVLSLLLKNN